MVYSAEHKIIFLKTSKVGGTSVEIYLSQILGESDVLTKIYPPEEEHYPRNYLNKNLFLRCIGLNYKNHMTARSVIRLIGKKQYEKCHSFTIEREPVAKTLSMWAMINSRREKQLTIDEHFETKIFPEDSHIWQIDKKLAVSEIIKYEDDVYARLNQLFRTPLGNRMIRIPKAKTSNRKMIKLEKRQIEDIYSAFHQSLKFTNYKVEDALRKYGK